MNSTELAITNPTAHAYLDHLSANERQLVDSVVEELNEVHALGNLATARQIGKVIVHRIFDGDIDGFRSGHKNKSTYRALAEHEALRPSYSSLWYSVAVYEHFEKIDEQVAGALTLAHHRALAHVHDAGARGELAARAVNEKLTAEQLQAVIRGAAPARPADAPARGRPRLPDVVKGLTKAGKVIAGLVSDARLAALDGKTVGPDERAAAAVTARRIAEQATILAERLERSGHS